MLWITKGLCLLLTKSYSSPPSRTPPGRSSSRVSGVARRVGIVGRRSRNWRVFVRRAVNEATTTPEQREQDHGPVRPHQLGTLRMRSCTVLPIGNILASLLATFAAFGRHCLLWPKATTFERSQRPYLWSSAPKVRCGQRPQQLKGHR